MPNHEVYPVGLGEEKVLVVYSQMGGKVFFTRAIHGQEKFDYVKGEVEDFNLDTVQEGFVTRAIEYEAGTIEAYMADRLEWMIQAGKKKRFPSLRDKFRPKAVLPEDPVEMLHKAYARGEMDPCDICHLSGPNCLPDCEIRRWRIEKIRVNLEKIKGDLVTATFTLLDLSRPDKNGVIYDRSIAEKLCGPDGHRTVEVELYVEGEEDL